MDGSKMTLTGGQESAMRKELRKKGRRKAAVSAASPDVRDVWSLSDRQRAIHEAGHAIASIRLGYRIKRVTIRRSGNGRAGSTVRVRPSGKWVPSFEEVCMRMAGYAADLLSRGGTGLAVPPFAHVLMAGAYDDFTAAVTIVRSYVEKDDPATITDAEMLSAVDQEIELAWRYAVAMAKQNMTAIEDLAERLIEARTIRNLSFSDVQLECSSHAIGLAA